MSTATNEDVCSLLFLDCDPGHDDAIAILMALYEPSIELVGLSTVHGNASLENTTINAARCLEAFGAPKHIRVYPGASKPLIGLPLPAVDIHGNDGLGGVEGLPDANDPAVLARIVPSDGISLPAIEGIKNAALQAVQSARQMYLGVTGSATNAAIFLLTYPKLAKKAIKQIVMMGGGVGLGNVTASAEFNIYIDPEAAQVVFESGIPIFTIPLNVTHQAIFHVDAHRHLLDPSSDPSATASQPLPRAITPLRHTLSTLLTFFAKTYRDVFGFAEGPPVHDALVVAYIARPQAFQQQLCRVDAELAGKHTRGALAVDTFNRDPTVPKNVEMALKVDVSRILRDFFSAVHKADQKSPLNSAVASTVVTNDMPPIPEVAVREAVSA
ncbi:Inosine/uridine-preferring nucleoside hydrolase [Cystobasidium minutum MCA 4210]|uniref:Inosine/uridine-preferring nucleoside hydrolase n=1 Tax=Cystobasidium minutum MCA 4210 TaxID=1397322 RepID=UPI0034CEF8AA|eukprot:jgi/Rhomi1/192384/gm1.598_g